MADSIDFNASVCFDCPISSLLFASFAASSIARPSAVLNWFKDVSKIFSADF